MKNTVAIKITILFVSLLFFFTLLELGLRISGNFFIKGRIKASLLGKNSKIKENYKKNLVPIRKDDNVILCLGDSYTFGGNLPPDETYPYFLGKILNKKYPDKKYRVINGGVCEYNSRQVLKRLPYFIKEYKPKIIFLLVGSSDSFNLASYNFEERGIESIFADLRIYKMLKIIFLNIKAKFLSLKSSGPFIQKNRSWWNTKSDFGFDGFPLKKRESLAKNYFEKMKSIKNLSTDQSSLEKAWYYFNNGNREKAIEICKDSLKTDQNSTNTLSDLAHFYYFIPDFYYIPKKDKFPDYCNETNILYAEQLYMKALSLDPESEFLLSRLSFFYNTISDYYTDTHVAKYDLAVISTLKALELDPSNYDLFAMLLYSSSLQSRYNENYVPNAFKKMLKNNPDLLKNKLFENYRVIFNNKAKYEFYIHKLVQRNLESIVALCKKNSIKLIMQNYPDSFTSVNEILKKISAEHSLLFVDNQKAFKDLIKNNREEYLIDDEHCTPKGFKVMAQNAAEILINNFNEKK